VRHTIDVQIDAATSDGTVVDVDGQRATVRLERVAGSECFRLDLGDRVEPVRIREAGGSLLVTIGGARVPVEIRRALPIPSRRAGRSAAAARVEIRAPMPGLVVALPRAVGDLAQAGSAVAVVEAMKMQMEVPSPVAGRVEEIRVRPGQEVMGGQVLAVIDVTASAPAAGSDAGR
jgi:biotin carboxyl carrier protein